MVPLVRHSEVFRQGYLSNNPAVSVRVQIADEKTSLNIKGMMIGTHRPEDNIPLQDVAELLDQLCARPMIEKTCHFVEYAGKTWEIDEFAGMAVDVLLDLSAGLISSNRRRFVRIFIFYKILFETFTII